MRVAINPLISVMGMQLPEPDLGRDHPRRRAVAADDWAAVPARPAEPGHYLAGTFLLMLALMLMLGNLLADIAAGLGRPTDPL